MLRAGPDPGSPERLLFRCNTMPATCDVDVVPDAFHFKVDHRRTRARFLASRACSGDLGTARRRNPVLAPHTQSRTLDLATQDRDLVSEHDDLDRQFVLFAPAKPEQLEYPNEGHIEEGQRRRFSQMERDPHVHEIIVQVGRARRRPTPRVLFQADVMSLRACSRGTQCLVERCPSTYPQTYPPAALCSTRSTSASGSTAWRNSSSVAQAAP